MINAHSSQTFEIMESKLSGKGSLTQNSYIRKNRVFQNNEEIGCANVEDGETFFNRDGTVNIALDSDWKDFIEFPPAADCIRFLPTIIP